MSTTPYTVRLEPALKRALEREAAFEDRPPAQLAVRAIRAMLDAKQAKRAAIEAALGDAEAGRFVSEEAMTAWIDSWDTDDEGPAPQADIHPGAP